MPTRTDYRHIVLDEQGRAFGEGHHRMQVSILAAQALAKGWSPEELEPGRPDTGPLRFSREALLARRGDRR